MDSEIQDATIPLRLEESEEDPTSSLIQDDDEDSVVISDYQEFEGLEDHEYESAGLEHDEHAIAVVADNSCADVDSNQPVITSPFQDTISPSNTLSMTPSRAHPFQTNPDIISELCELIYRGDYPSTIETRQSRSTLRSLALACRAFLEPALDRLWRSLDSLFPLLCLLPAFGQSDGTYVLRGRITPEQWAKFDSYASRIRRFSYSRDPDSLDIAMHVYFRLGQLRSTPLLPGLLHLHCPSTSQGDFLVSGICLFLSPSLQRLSLGGISSVEDKLCGTLLHTLREEGAQITKVTLRGRGLSRDTLCLAVGFQGLRELELTGMGGRLDWEVLRRVGALPWLKDLKIDFTDSPLCISGLPPTIVVEEREEDQDKEGFTLTMKELKSLTITAPLSFVEDFQARIGCNFTNGSTTTTGGCALEALTIISYTSSPALSSDSLPPPHTQNVDKKRFMQKIVEKWADTLCSLSLIIQPPHLIPSMLMNALAPTPVITDGIDTPSPETELSVEAISPLFIIPSLSHLRIEGYTMDLTDEDLHRLSSAWPNLESLLFPYISPPRSRPTFEGLKKLGEVCPRLSALRIPLGIDTFNLKPFVLAYPSPSHRGPQGHPLQTLSIASPSPSLSTLSNPGDTDADESSGVEVLQLKDMLNLARYVDGIFPNVGRVCGYVAGGDLIGKERDREDAEGWSQMGDVVKMFQLVRREVVTSGR